MRDRRASIRATKPRPKHQLKGASEMLINCPMWTTYPQTHILLKASLSCTSLKMTKLSSRWWSKDEVQQWDTCPELTELCLIVGRIHLEPKIQIKCWHQKTTRWHADQRKFHTWWVESSSPFVQHCEFLNVLLQPLQQFSFWSDQKAERRVKERQEVTSSEGSPIPKPKPMVPAMAKPMNLLLHNPLNARKKKPPQDVRDPANLVNVDEVRGGHSDHPKPRSNRIFSSEATWKHSTCRLLETGRQRWIFEIDQHQETGAGTGYSTLAMKALNKDRCVDMENVHVFVNKAAIHLG